MRMTNVSKENIRIADHVRIEPHDIYDGWFAVVIKGDHRAYVSSNDGPVLYPSPTHVYKAIRRINKTVPVTTI